MVEILPETTEAGLWLQVHELGRPIVGAHVGAEDHDFGRLTIMWSGHLIHDALATFCTKVSEQLDPNDKGTMSLLGREFSHGARREYQGKYWLEAGQKPDVLLLRYECSATLTRLAGPPPSERVIVWAASETMPPPKADEPQEIDENVGVNLELARLTPLAGELALLIAKSQVNGFEIDVIRSALRLLQEYLAPKPKVIAAAA